MPVPDPWDRSAWLGWLHEDRPAHTGYTGYSCRTPTAGSLVRHHVFQFGVLKECPIIGHLRDRDIITLRCMIGSMMFLAMHQHLSDQSHRNIRFSDTAGPSLFKCSCCSIYGIPVHLDDIFTLLDEGLLDRILDQCDSFIFRKYS